MKKLIILILVIFFISYSNASFAMRVVSPQILCPACDKVICPEIKNIPDGCSLIIKKMENGCPGCCEEVTCPPSNSITEDDCRCKEGEVYNENICIGKPFLACTREYRPVCGCDGITYSNKCSAHAKGIKSFTEGVCNNKMEIPTRDILK